VGQHPRMVGQHKSEKWVNMLQNVHYWGQSSIALCKVREVGIYKWNTSKLPGR